MITCCVKYTIDPYKLADFESYARKWIEIVNRLGGLHHGYFLPGEGANDQAICLFSFENLRAYEVYRDILRSDPEARELNEFAARTRCIVRYTRTFMRPMLD